MQSRISESEPNSRPIIQGTVHTLSTSPSDKRGPCVPCLHKIPSSLLESLPTRPVMAVHHLRYGMDILGINSVSDPFLDAKDHFRLCLCCNGIQIPYFASSQLSCGGLGTWFGVVAS